MMGFLVSNLVKENGVDIMILYNLAQLLGMILEIPLRNGLGNFTKNTQKLV
jgi:hypothetical protein